MMNARDDVLRVHRDKAAARASYNRLSRIYDLFVARGEQVYRDAGLRMLDVLPGEIVLEIGFGTGLALVRLAEAVGEDGRVIGIDLSQGMLEVSERRLKKAGLREQVDLILSDATQLPIRRDACDAVWMCFTLELFDTPEIPLVLAQCRRILKPSGRMAVVSLSRSEPQAVMTRLYEWGHMRLPSLLDCRPIHPRKALEAAGFHILREEHMRHWGMPVDLVCGMNDQGTSNSAATAPPGSRKMQKPPRGPSITSPPADRR